MKKLLVIATLTLTACQTGPDIYKPMVDKPTAYEQAIAICDNKAKAAKAHAKVDADPWQTIINGQKSEMYTRRACMAEHGYTLADS